MKRFLETSKKVVGSKIFIFFFTAAIMFAVSFNTDLISVSGDAAETWKVANTLFSAKKFYSYVMYKGIYAFLPAWVDIRLSALLHIPQQITVKLFNAACFGYLAAFGVPGIIEIMHPNKKLSLFQKYLFTALLILLEHHIVLFLSVDLSCVALIFALSGCALRSANDEKVKLTRFLSLGLLFGLNMCFSGQFSLSAIIIVAAAVFSAVWRHFKKHGIRAIRQNGVLLAALAVSAFGALLTRGPDLLYFALVVNPARAAGEWIPTGGDWLLNGLTQNLLRLNYPRNLPDNLGRGFIPADQLEYVKSGGLIYTPRAYAKLVLTHPIEFIVRWCERFFIGMMNDTRNQFGVGGYTLHPYLQVGGMAVMIYAFANRFKGLVKKYRDIFSVKTFVYFGILMSALVPSFGHLENRYFFAARAVVYGVFALSPYLNEAAATVKNKIKNKSLEPVSWHFWGCAVFVLLCIILYLALYQSAGVTYFVE